MSLDEEDYMYMHKLEATVAYDALIVRARWYIARDKEVPKRLVETLGKFVLELRITAAQYKRDLGLSRHRSRSRR